MNERTDKQTAKAADRKPQNSMSSPTLLDDKGATKSIILQDVQTQDACNHYNGSRLQTLISG